MPFQYLQKHSINKSRLSDSLNGQRWRFLQRGSDDVQDGFVTQGAKGPVPVVLPSKPDGPYKTQQRPKKMPTKPRGCLSKLSPTQQARKDRIAEVEYCLSQHPLTLYPHLEESVPLELFKEVMSILDPEMLPLSEDTDLEQELLIPSRTQSHVGDKKNRQKQPKLFSCKNPKGKDPYTWFSKKEVAAREMDARLNYVPPLDENVKQATEEFCSWFESLGGEKYNIDEATIIDLFDARYETKPSHSVPVRVVELNDLPAELRKNTGILPPQATMKNNSQEGNHSKESCQPKREKIRYGAWYLDPETWKKQKVSEPLEDPTAEDTKMKNSSRKSLEKDAEIMKLYGTHAFKEFLDRKGYRIPEFLQQILSVQDAVGAKKGPPKGSRSEFQRHEELRKDSPSRTGN